MHKIIHGDCIETLKRMRDKSVDCIITDPPYGVELKYCGYRDSQENLKNLIAAFMPEALRVAHRVVLTCGTNNIHLYPRPTWILAWYMAAGKGCTSWGFSCWQPILVYGKDPYLANRMGGRPDVIPFNGGRPNPYAHPCPKPLPFMLKLVERVSVKRTDTILDPFMGAGTTGVACKRLGRRFIGIEQSARYVRIARRRIQKGA